MLLLKPTRSVKYIKSPVINNLKEITRKLSTGNARFSTQSDLLDNENPNTTKSKPTDKLLFNSVICAKKYEIGYFQTRKLLTRKKRIKESIQPLPLSLRYICEDTIPAKKTEISKLDKKENFKNVQFPFNTNSSSNIDELIPNEEIFHVQKNTPENIDKEVRTRHKELRKWMNSYDNFEHDIVENDENVEINYGTPDPLSKISSVPCGGCGAFLHCKDTAIPGYIPSEIFKNSHKPGAAILEAIICQRCFFLKEHDIALQVRVSARDYPKVLMSLRNKKALVILMVDLTDFPCSIWPGIADILDHKTPIFIVGNKIDLIPKDSDNFISVIKEKLLDYIKICGFGTSNILNVAIISAKTGYGIEELITSLQTVWRVRGDVYLVGCTNVGKSSLFNALLSSDYCKVKAADLIQRATTSQWPGTTLNLLKFPILRLSAQRLQLRTTRLSEMNRAMFAEEERRNKQLKLNNIAENATLIGRIEHSFSKHSLKQEKLDGFSVQASQDALGRTSMGVNENHPDFALGRWCYDTPGVVHPDQILDLLTLEELICTLPKQLIRPETFCLKPRTSLLIAGLARLDYLNGPNSIKLTVFRSKELPITICKVDEAENVYNEYLGTELFKVPNGEGDRLKKWPGLEKANPFTITGIDRIISSKDIVLSNAGWISITCSPGKEYTFQPWTPQKRGIHLRDCILPKAVMLRGNRIRMSVHYAQHQFI